MPFYYIWYCIDEQFALNDKLNMEKESTGGKQTPDDKRRAVEVM